MVQYSRAPRLSEHTYTRIDKELYTNRLTGDLLGKVKEIDKLYREMIRPSGVMRQINRQSLNYIINHAVANLNRSVRANRSNTAARTGKLVATIKNRNSHLVAQNSFRFMVVERVDTIMGHKENYAFSLEYGSNYWVNKYQWFTFVGRKLVGVDRGGTGSYARRNDPASKLTARQKPSGARGTKTDGGVHRFGGKNANIVGDRIIGPRENQRLGGAFSGARRVKVKITRPVPAYLYGTKAVEQFQDTGQYVKLLRQDQGVQQLERITGTKLVPRGTNGRVTRSR